MEKDRNHFITLMNLDEVRFHDEFRMTKASFSLICALIENHAVFRNSFNNTQVSVQKQLAVAVFRFGNDGNAASIGKTARKFGISEGSVELSTRRVIKALVSIEPEYLKWPNAGERQIISNRIFRASGFANCVGYVDGTLVKLAAKPVDVGADYFDRKSSYFFRL